jgi:predicted PurR-regulated permease PerM
VIRTGQSPVVLTAAVLVGAVAVLYFARDILIPLALAITFALVLSPAVAWLRRLHLPRFAATLLVMLVSVSMAGTVGYVIFNQLLQVVNELPSYRENINNKLKTLRAPHKGALGRAVENVKELGKELTSAEGGDKRRLVRVALRGFRTRSDGKHPRLKRDQYLPKKMATPLHCELAAGAL